MEPVDIEFGTFELSVLQTVKTGVIDAVNHIFDIQKVFRTRIEISTHPDTCEHLFFAQNPPRIEILLDFAEGEHPFPDFVRIMSSRTK